MLIPFEKINNDSRIWVFQSNRKLNSEETRKIEKSFDIFLSTWATHGTQLNSAYKIFNNLQIVIGVDLNVQAASGCSIDSLTQKVQQLGKELGVDFFDRRSTAIENNGIVTVLSFEEIREKISTGEVMPSTIVYNNLIQTKGELEKNWKIKAEESWIKRYFQKAC